MILVTSTMPTHQPFDKVPPSIGGDAWALIAKAAAADTNVCIQSESKPVRELVARLIHSSGSRRDNPFVTLDIGTTPDILFEFRLFGIAEDGFNAGAPTRDGALERAHTGTVFLDGISELAPQFQAKLLQVIKSGEFCAIGAFDRLHLNARLITGADPRHLRKTLDAQEFDGELYARIAAIGIEIAVRP
jgi:DNA-binding NtrC family response regulator